MENFRGSSRACVALGLSLVVGFIFQSPSSAGLSDKYLDAATMSTDLPPSFDDVDTTGLVGVMTSCTGNKVKSVLQGLGEATTATLAKGLQGTAESVDTLAARISITTECPVAGEPATDPEDVSCDLVMSGEDFSGSKWKDLLGKNQSALAALACQKAKTSAIHGELECLNQQMNQLQKKLATVQQAYSENINRMAQDVEQLDTLAKDRIQQRVDVNEKLNGRAPGQIGLLQLRDQTQAMIDAMNTDYQQIEEAQKDVENKKTVLEETAKTRTVELTGQCFTTPEATYHCGTCDPKKDQGCNPKNLNPAVSAAQYALCRYEQNQRLSSTGRREESGFVESDAAVARGNLENVLARMTQELSTAGTPGATLVQTINSELEKGFGSELQRFNGKGLDIRSFVLNKMKSCLSAANQKVKQERVTLSSRSKDGQSLGGMSAEITKLERDASKNVKDLMSKYSTQHAALMRGLTGVGNPLVKAGCDNAKPSAQLSCVSWAKGKLDDALWGVSTTKSQINIAGKQYKNNNGGGFNTTIPVVCKGLSGPNGCIAKLQDLDKDLEREVQNVQESKTKYVTQANNNIQGFASKVAQQMGDTAAISALVEKLKSAIGKIPGMTPLSIGSIKADKLEIDPKTGLYMAPSNVVALIGSQMSPPMPDLEGGNLSDVLGELSEKNEEVNKSFSQATQAISKIQELKAKCSKKALTTKMETLSTKVTDLIVECRDVSYCSGSDNLTDLSSLISDIGGGGLDSDAISSLNNGLARLPCSSKSTGETSSSKDEESGDDELALMSSAAFKGDAESECNEEKATVFALREEKLKEAAAESRDAKAAAGAPGATEEAKKQDKAAFETLEKAQAEFNKNATELKSCIEKKSKALAKEANAEIKDKRAEAKEKRDAAVTCNRLHAGVEKAAKAAKEASDAHNAAAGQSQ